MKKFSARNEIKPITENWNRFLNEGTWDDAVASALGDENEDTQSMGGDNMLSPSSAGQAQNPLKNAGRLSSPMGDKRNRRFSHNGQDISAPVGTNVYPLAEGIVVSVRGPEEFVQKSKSALRLASTKGVKVPDFINNDMRLVDFNHPDIQGESSGCPKSAYRWVQEAFKAGGFNSWKEGGVWVMIKHPNLTKEGKEITAWYAHLHDLSVSEGEEVDMDTVIGTVGRSGVVCNQPHLHLEMFTGNNLEKVSGKVAGGELINPMEFIA